MALHAVAWVPLHHVAPTTHDAHTASKSRAHATLRKEPVPQSVVHACCKTPSHHLLLSSSLEGVVQGVHTASDVALHAVEMNSWNTAQVVVHGRPEIPSPHHSPFGHGAHTESAVRVQLLATIIPTPHSVVQSCFATRSHHSLSVQGLHTASAPAVHALEM
jgi:hypothetical protein